MVTGKVSCLVCVMDSTAKEFISFGELGCSFCMLAKENWKIIQQMNQRKNVLDDLLQIIEVRKKSARNQTYDAILGISGGIDSSFLLHSAVKHGLRVLPVHVDAGWNTRIALSNIYSLIEKLNLDLKTIVIDWQEMQKLQVAFLKSGVMNQDAPQDHAFVASLKEFALKLGVKTILSGANYATESIGPSSWGHPAGDGSWVRDVYKKEYRSRPKKFPIWKISHELKCRYAKPSLLTLSILDQVDYRPSTALPILVSKYNYKTYGDKHTESRFTKFFQEVYLPERFGIDKRKSHLSSLIVSGEISRQESINLLSKPTLNSEERNQLMTFIAIKLGLKEKTLVELMQNPIDTSEQFKSQLYLYTFLGQLSKVKNKFNFEI